MIPKNLKERDSSHVVKGQYPDSVVGKENSPWTALKKISSIKTAIQVYLLLRAFCVQILGILAVVVAIQQQVLLWGEKSNEGVVAG